MEIDKKKANLNVFPFGYYEDGTMAGIDLSRLPHLIVGGGAEGHQTDRFVQEFITWLCETRTPEQVQFVLIDSKRKALSRFAGDPHLVVPVIGKCSRAVYALHWAVAEIERRMKLFASAHVRTIDAFNARSESSTENPICSGLETTKLPKTLPDIVLVITETEEILPKAGDVVVLDIIRLAQKAHFAGIHLVIAAENPSATSIPKKVKDSIVGRIVFRVADKRASKWILGEAGAERLNAVCSGDAFVRSGDGAPILMTLQTPRVQRADENVITRRTGAVYDALSAAVREKKQLYPVLVELLGKPICTTFKVRMRGKREAVVGGEFKFKGDAVSRVTYLDEDQIHVYGRISGGGIFSFVPGLEARSEDAQDAPICKALIKMFARLYSEPRKDRQD